MEHGTLKKISFKFQCSFFFSLSFPFSFSCVHCSLLATIAPQKVKEISNFLSHNGIVLEELNLGLKEKEEISQFNIKQETTNLEMKVVFNLLKD